MLMTIERPHKVQPVADDEGAGESIRERRKALGMTVKALADLAGVDRGRLAKIEAGANARDATVGAIEATLRRLEEEVSGPYDNGERGLVTFNLSGDFGVEVTVKGPVENLDELEASVERLIRRMRNKPDKQ